jgi:hypothetical protein
MGGTIPINGTNTTININKGEHFKNLLLSYFDDEIDLLETGIPNWINTDLSGNEILLNGNNLNIINDTEYNSVITYKTSDNTFEYNNTISINVNKSIYNLHEPIIINPNELYQYQIFKSELLSFQDAFGGDLHISIMNTNDWIGYDVSGNEIIISGNNQNIIANLGMYIINYTTTDINGYVNDYEYKINVFPYQDDVNRDNIINIDNIPDNITLNAGEHFKNILVSYLNYDEGQYTNINIPDNIINTNWPDWVNYDTSGNEIIIYGDNVNIKNNGIFDIKYDYSLDYEQVFKEIKITINDLSNYHEPVYINNKELKQYQIFKSELLSFQDAFGEDITTSIINIPHWINYDLSGNEIIINADNLDNNYGDHIIELTTEDKIGYSNTHELKINVIYREFVFNNYIDISFIKGSYSPIVIKTIIDFLEPKSNNITYNTVDYTAQKGHYILFENDYIHEFIKIMDTYNNKLYFDKELSWDFTSDSSSQGYFSIYDIKDLYIFNGIEIYRDNEINVKIILDDTQNNKLDIISLIGPEWLLLTDDNKLITGTNLSSSRYGSFNFTLNVRDINNKIYNIDDTIIIHDYKPRIITNGFDINNIVIYQGENIPNTIQIKTYNTDIVNLVKKPNWINHNVIQHYGYKTCYINSKNTLYNNLELDNEIILQAINNNTPNNYTYLTFNITIINTIPIIDPISVSNITLLQGDHFNELIINSIDAPGDVGTITLVNTDISWLNLTYDSSINKYILNGNNDTINNIGTWKQEFNVIDTYSGTSNSELTIQINNRPPNFKNFINNISYYKKQSFSNIIIDAYNKGINGNIIDDKIEIHVTAGTMLPNWFTFTKNNISDIYDYSYTLVCDNITVDRVGEYTISFSTTDRSGAHIDEELIITILNIPPVFNTINDYSINQGEIFEISYITFIKFYPSDIIVVTKKYDISHEWLTVIYDDMNGYYLMCDNEAYDRVGVYNITLIGTDQHGDSTEETFIITVVNVPPVFISGNGILDIVQDTSLLHYITFNGPDTINVDIEGDISWLMAIQNSNVETILYGYPTNAMVGYQQNITLIATDSHGGVTRDSLIINISNLNDPITNIKLEFIENSYINKHLYRYDYSIQENTFEILSHSEERLIKVIDIDLDNVNIVESHIFELIAPLNPLFSLSDDNTKLIYNKDENQIIDYENPIPLVIYIKATDLLGLTFTKQIIFNILDKNDLATDFELTHNEIIGQNLGIVIGTFEMTDPDRENNPIYYSFNCIILSVLNGDGINIMDTFEISKKNILKLKDDIYVEYNNNFSTYNNYTITIECYDDTVSNINNRSFSYTKTFTLDVINPVNNDHRFTTLSNTILNPEASLVDYTISTNHPYSSLQDITWDVEIQEASGYYIYFSSKTNTEYGYDFVYILNNDGTEIDKYSGNSTRFPNYYNKLFIPSTFKVRFVSDSSSINYGFDLHIDGVVTSYNSISIVPSSIIKSNNLDKIISPITNNIKTTIPGSYIYEINGEHSDLLEIVFNPITYENILQVKNDTFISFATIDLIKIVIITWSNPNIKYYTSINIPVQIKESICTNINITSTNIAENKVGYHIGTLTAQSLNINDIYTFELAYTLIDEHNPNIPTVLLGDNDMFTIENNILKLKDDIILHYDINERYSFNVYINVFNFGFKNFYQKQFTLNLIENRILLSNNQIPENMFGAYIADINTVYSDINLYTIELLINTTIFKIVNNKLYLQNNKKLYNSSTPSINIVFKLTLININDSINTIPIQNTISLYVLSNILLQKQLSNVYRDKTNIFKDLGGINQSTRSYLARKLFNKTSIIQSRITLEANEIAPNVSLITNFF